MEFSNDLTSDDFGVVPSSYFRWKRAIGQLLAGLLFIPGLPLMLLLVVIVRLSSRGPGIYRQMRMGRNGRTFWMYKIRTMRQDAEAKSGPAWTQKNDPRITRVGRILRKLHLDEVPQLINVVRGEMSIIGPRPERPEFVKVLAKEIPGYTDRLAVAPGITGLAQINLPPDTDLDSVRRKLVLDLEYIQQASPLLDGRMFCCTLLRILGIRGELAMRMMGLRREVNITPQGKEIPTPESSAAHPTPVSICTNDAHANGTTKIHALNSTASQNGVRQHAASETEFLGKETASKDVDLSKNSLRKSARLSVE